MLESKYSLDLPGAAVLYLDRESEEIYYCNQPARDMLGKSAGSLLGRRWADVLGVPPELERALASAIQAGGRVAIAPTLVHPPQATEMVLGGYLFAQEHQGRRAVVLLLFSLASGEASLFSRALEPSDAVAVLGIDIPDSHSQWRPGDLARCMIDIRFGLQQIVPARDDVGLPVGTTIPVALRDVTPEQAQDISRALLSHLTPLLAGRARIRVGLAQCMQGESALAALVAANTALLLLQRASPGELVGVAAGDRNGQLHAVNAASQDGIFSTGQEPGAPRGYLAALAALVMDPHHGEDFLAKLVSITLGQPGVCAVGLYRRRYDDSYEFAAGGLAGEEGAAVASEKQLPRAIRQMAHRQATNELRAADCIRSRSAATAVFPLKHYESVLGYMVLQYLESAAPGLQAFTPDISALHHLAIELSALPDWRQAGEESVQPPPAAPRPVDETIDGYVGDNMEGAIDQAIFLSRVDIPVAVIGPRGTGKLYVAKVIHQESGGPPDKLVSIDCREFRGRKDALNRIARELERSQGKTLVFKSPHLMNPDAQLKLARQISTRILADTNPPRYLPAARIIALFPDSLEYLVRHGGLNDRLASVFAAYPIRVPPLRDRRRAVLRWAHKILAQEGARRDRKLTGFTPDAEQALLRHDWPGNISEMRQCIVSALDKTDKEWLTPVDLGIFKGLTPAGRPALPEKRPFLQALLEEPQEEEDYTPTTLEELQVALGEALHGMLETGIVKPLGAWTDDEVIIAACERYRENMRAAADFLHTKPRNIGRWMPKVLDRDPERAASALWQSPQRLIRQWIREAPPLAEPPQQIVHDILLSHVLSQGDKINVADRARIMGVSIPTYQKRLQEILQRQSQEQR